MVSLERLGGPDPAGVHDVLAIELAQADPLEDPVINQQHDATGLAQGSVERNQAHVLRLQ